MNSSSQGKRDLREHAELGRLLAAATGYRVCRQDGHEVGVLDHVRYGQHFDHPDEIIVRRGRLLRRRRAVPFDAVEAVRPRERVVVVRVDTTASQRPSRASPR